MNLIDTVYAHDSNVCCILKLDLLIIILLVYILIYTVLGNLICKSHLQKQTKGRNGNV